MSIRSRGLSRWDVASMLAAAAFLAFGAVDASAQTSDLRLMEAVRLQDSEAVERLLHASADVNAPQADGATALHWAAYLDDVETARLLLEAGADAGVANTHGVVPLSLACTNANAAMVDLLLAAGADAKAAVGTGETVLMSCARTGNARGCRRVAGPRCGRQCRRIRGGPDGADVGRRPTASSRCAGAARQRGPTCTNGLVSAASSSAGGCNRIFATASSAGATVPTPRRLTSAATRRCSSRRGRARSTRRACCWRPAPTSTTPRRTAGARCSWRRTADIAQLVEFLLAEGANPNASAAGYTALHAAVLQDDQRHAGRAARVRRAPRCAGDRGHTRHPQRPGADDR